MQLWFVCSGRRVAFSCIGSVVSLSGEPEGAVALEAVGIGGPCKDQQEEAVSEPSGHFRVRGLLPNVSNCKKQAFTLHFDK
jgi:hypothetical protein